MNKNMCIHPIVYKLVRTDRKRSKKYIFNVNDTSFIIFIGIRFKPSLSFSFEI